MQWGPCYSLTRVQELFAGRESMNVDDLLELDISARDKLWVILRPDIIPEKGLHELACIYAEEALNCERAAGCEPDPALWAAIAAKRAWLRGDIADEQLHAARDAARHAARHVARDRSAATTEWQLQQAIAVIRGEL